MDSVRPDKTPLSCADVEWLRGCVLTEDEPRHLAEVEEVVDEEDSMLLLVPLKHLQELLQAGNGRGYKGRGERG